MTNPPPPDHSSSWRRRSRLTWAALFTLGLCAVGVWAVYFGLSLRTPPERCGEGLVVRGPRCCAPGQLLDEDFACVGVPSSCPRGLELTPPRRGPAPEPGLPAGCVAPRARVTLPAGEVLVGPSDWQSEHTPARRLHVAAFALDVHEVTHHAWSHCAASGLCRALRAREPGVPVTDVSAEEAARYCALEGGRLPTRDELIYASAGTSARRFAWGPTGLVCRRAAYGLVNGPCGSGARGPELAGARPAGATPEGLLDLSGNVAEWTREPDGETSLHGGSFRSKLASELTSFSARPPRAGGDVGFRCAYDADTPREPSTTR